MTVLGFFSVLWCILGLACWTLAMNHILSDFFTNKPIFVQTMFFALSVIWLACSAIIAPVFVPAVIEGLRSQSAYISSAAVSMIIMTALFGFGGVYIFVYHLTHRLKNKKI